MPLDYGIFRDYNTKPVTILSKKQISERKMQLNISEISVHEFELELDRIVNHITDTLKTRSKIDNEIKMNYYGYIFKYQNVGLMKSINIVKKFVEILKNYKNPNSKDYFFKIISFIFSTYICSFQFKTGKTPNEVSEFVKIHNDLNSEEIYNLLIKTIKIS